MPGYKTHLFIGFSILTIFSLLTNFDYHTFTVFFLITVVYSLLPDIDIGNSKIAIALRLTLGLMTIGFIILDYLLGYPTILFAILALAILVILEFTKHRHFVHTIRMAILISLPLLLIDIPHAIFGFVCYVFHLGVDGTLNI